MKAAIVYPHQLFPDRKWLDGIDRVYLVEDPLLFRQYRFHRQKLLLHRASMKAYADTLSASGKTVRYVDAHRLEHSSDLGEVLHKDRVKSVRAVDPEDHNLRLRFQAGCRRQGIDFTCIEDPHFLTSIEQIDRFVDGKKKLFFTNFYIEQRKRLRILLEGEDKPVGGK